MANVPQEPFDVKFGGFHAGLSRLEVECLKSLRGTFCPFDLLVAIERRQRACTTRAGAARVAMREYPRFLALVVRYPEADRDALIHAARRTFMVNIPTMRTDLRGLSRLLANTEGAA